MPCSVEGILVLSGTDKIVTPVEIHVEHDATGWPSTVHKIDPPARDPPARQVGKSRKVLGRFETPHLARRSRTDRRCRRQSSASPDHDAAARRRSHPRIRQGRQIPTAETARPMHVEHSCQCVHRLAHYSPSRSSRLRRRVRDRRKAQHGKLTTEPRNWRIRRRSKLSRTASACNSPVCFIIPASFDPGYAADCDI